MIFGNAPQVKIIGWRGPSRDHMNVSLLMRRRKIYCSKDDTFRSNAAFVHYPKRKMTIKIKIIPQTSRTRDEYGNYNGYLPQNP